jgi:hypothetical protein
MATLSKQELSAQLNLMKSQGATPEQISAAINSAGYDQLTDFATDESGNFSSLSPQDSTSKVSELSQVSTATTPSPDPAPSITTDDPVVSNANSTTSDLLKSQVSSGVQNNTSEPAVTRTQTSAGITEQTSTNASRTQTSTGLTDTPPADAATRNQTSTGLTDTPPADAATRNQTSTGITNQTSTTAARNQTSTGLTDTPANDTPTRNQTSTGLTDTPANDTPTRNQTSTGLADSPSSNTPTRNQTSTGLTDTPANDTPTRNQTSTGLADSPSSDTPTRNQTSTGLADTPVSDTPVREQQSSGVDEQVQIGEVGKPQSFVEDQEATSYAVATSYPVASRSLPDTDVQGTTVPEISARDIKPTEVATEDPTVIATKEITIPQAELPEGVVAESYPVKDQQAPADEEYPPEQSSSARAAVSEPETQTPLDNSVWTSTYDIPPAPAKTLEELQSKVSESAEGSAAVAAAVDTAKNAVASNVPSIVSQIQNARSSNDVENKLSSSTDWRFRIRIANSAAYLYRDPDNLILAPLRNTHGVVFPYTPNITMGYSANYDKVELPHTNYHVYNYKNSMVDQISITADFTAQDSKEAAYMLAVIHFFKSATKMFYGQGELKGMPPPVCFLNGFGQYHFNDHPVVIVGFNYTYKNDVDYIDAYVNSSSKSMGSTSASETRISAAGLKRAAMDKLNKFSGAMSNSNSSSSSSSSEPTKMPTKIELSITCYPIVSRANVSNNFKFDDYASGKLLQGKTNGFGGGFW